MIVVALVVVVVFTGHHGIAGVGDIGKPVPTNVMNNLTSVPASTFDAAGAKDAKTPLNVASTSTSAQTSSTPLLLYMGSEFCPFCAAERWVLVTALSRFGTWNNLTLTLSATTTSEAYPGTPTFSFLGSSFSSPYVNVETVEMQGRVVTNGQYPIVETPTTSQAVAIQKYDYPPYVATSTAGAIPFVLLNNRYMWSGASYSPQLLQGKTWDSISKDVHDGKAGAGQAILENANMVSAAICNANGGKPANVCNSAGVKAAAQQMSG